MTKSRSLARATIKTSARRLHGELAERGRGELSFHLQNTNVTCFVLMQTSPLFWGSHLVPRAPQAPDEGRQAWDVYSEGGGGDS